VERGSMPREAYSIDALANLISEWLRDEDVEQITFASAAPDSRAPVAAVRSNGEIRFEGLSAEEDAMSSDPESLIRHLLGQGLTLVSARTASTVTRVELVEGRLKLRREALHAVEEAFPKAEEQTGPVCLPQAHALLHAIGIATQDGRIRADRARKYAQVNRFVDLVSDYIAEISAKRPIHILDAGCGKSYLSFVLYYYLREVLQRECYIVGIDVNPDRVRDAEQIRQKLGYEHMEFRCGSIKSYRPKQPLDMLLSLHACDTATDEAIAVGLSLNARLIFLVPCCQHELLSQIKDNPLRSITRHPIYRARLADLLTDALRTCALEAAGYEVSVVEYVSPLDTPKNLMIRAKKVGGRNPAALARYRELTAMFGVSPSLQEMVPWLKEGSLKGR
jgi:SAM-dependent methyltransferase